MFGSGKHKIKEFIDGNDEMNDLKGLSFREFLNGEIFTRSFISNQLRFILFITFLAFCYIANHYRVEALLTDLSEVKLELKEKRSIAVTTSSELMHISKQSQVLRQVNEYGLELKPLTEPPRILEVE